MFRSCNKTRFISRIWLRFDTVNKLMWLCKNRTCEFKAYKVQLSAQSEWRKLTLPGLSICMQMKVWSVGPSDQNKSNTFLWTAGWCQLLFFFLFWLTFFVELYFFFPGFFYYFTKWKVIGKTANTNVRSKLKPQSFEMWDKQVICTFK